MAAFTRFDPKALAFLRALKRHNDREWFRARKDEYERALRGPMIAMIERLAGDFRAFAPGLSASPKTSLYRIYRDTRFSEDKTPLKTQVSAVFPHRELGKGRGAGLYLEVTPQWVWIGGGMYAPETPELVAVREHVAAHHRRLHAIVTSRGFTRTFGRLEGAQLQRVPRGFPKDHPAADYLRHRQFLAGAEFPPGFATSPGFYAGVVKTFRQAAPLIAFLNEPLVRR
jgi:uncharacterized protein (TIGR02453 family)